MRHLQAARVWTGVRGSPLAGLLLLAAAPAPATASGAWARVPSGVRLTTDSLDDHQHDFDFEFGSWRAHLRRRVHPLSGTDEWVEYDGTSTVRKVWGGRANLGELELKRDTSHLEGLSLRLYDPASHQWSVYWSNSHDGVLGAAMVGQFQHGRGEFFDQETLEGRAVFVRFVFSDVTAHAFRLEQAFSADGGRTWEANWIATFTRD